MVQPDGRIRVVIEGVRPEIEAGEWVVEADIFTDGHDLVAADLLYRPASDALDGGRVRWSTAHDVVFQPGCR